MIKEPNRTAKNHIADVGNMIAQRQEPIAWRITAKRFCGDFTKERDVAQYWLEKEPHNVTPLYLSPHPASRAQRQANRRNQSYS